MFDSSVLLLFFLSQQDKPFQASTGSWVCWWWKVTATTELQQIPSLSLTTRPFNLHCPLSPCRTLIIDANIVHAQTGGRRRRRTGSNDVQVELAPLITSLIRSARPHCLPHRIHSRTGLDTDVGLSLTINDMFGLWRETPCFPEGSSLLLVVFSAFRRTIDTCLLVD